MGSSFQLWFCARSHGQCAISLLQNIIQPDLVYVALYLLKSGSAVQVYTEEYYADISAATSYAHKTVSSLTIL